MAKRGKDVSAESTMPADLPVEDVVADGEGTDVLPAAVEPENLTLMQHMERAKGFEVHAIHARFAEMLPLLPAAIASVDDPLKKFFEELLMVLDVK